MTLRNGDSVYLKSNNLIMTVDKIENNNIIHCQWFDNGSLHGGSFHQHMIDFYDSSSFPSTDELCGN